MDELFNTLLDEFLVTLDPNVLVKLVAVIENPVCEIEEPMKRFLQDCADNKLGASLSGPGSSM